MQVNPSQRKPRVLVAMSGGVDSSVAAALLVDQGYDVVGATMQVWDYSSCDIQEGNGTCCSSIDVDDARAVADKIGIPFYVLNCEAKFKTSVIEPFIESYLQGQTPLPCVNCNTFLKFDHLIKKMQELECDYLATGHYAQIEKNNLGKSFIVSSEDEWKDQTYFLFTIQPELVEKLLFPVGHLKKNEVRAYAESRGLLVAKKKDSQGICFVGNMGYSNFIEQHVSAARLQEKSGQIRRYPSGEVMSTHSGIHLFTIGQSRGLGMTYHEKLFVLKVDAETNTVWVGEEKDLFSKTAQVINLHQLDEIHDGEEFEVKIRYQHKPSKGRVFFKENNLFIEFEEPQRAITPGQAAVLYRAKADGRRTLVGGGWIP